jgi:hypothetical protein
MRFGFADLQLSPYQLANFIPTSSAWSSIGLPQSTRTIVTILLMESTQLRPKAITLQEKTIETSLF